MVAKIATSEARGVLRQGPTLPSPGRLAVALAIARVLSPVFPPVIAIPRCPRALGSRLVLAIVGIARALGPLPKPPPFTLAGDLSAVALLGNLRSWPERLAAGSTSPTLHRPISAQITCAACRRPGRYYSFCSTARTILADASFAFSTKPPPLHTSRLVGQFP
jgi:hypothetical protein